MTQREPREPDDASASEDRRAGTFESVASAPCSTSGVSSSPDCHPASGSFSCWTSVREEIAIQAEVPVRTVRKTLNALVKEGFIDRHGLVLARHKTGQGSTYSFGSP